MSLAKYKQKRNFEDSPEPEGKLVKKADKLIFVVQRHQASHLHYDLRLELNGSLKSWAIPKGPSMNPKDKRLAVMVEDHPIDYADFEGSIPKGNYGAGEVMIWDHGTYEPIDDNEEIIPVSAFAKNLKNGAVKFKMNGKKLKGGFALVKFKNDEKSWLFIKHHDEYATEDDYNSEDFV